MTCTTPPGRSSPTARASWPPTRAPARSRSASTSIDVESTEDNRRAYRELLFTAPGAEEYISGVILFDETIRQTAADGTPFPELLAGEGIIPGIKVDAGAKPLALTEARRSRRVSTACGSGSPSTTASVRGSRSGARLFDRRRRPSEYAVWVNAHALARYAALAQEAGLVPIVEPEVLMDGAHTIEESAKATGRVLQAVYTELHDQRVDLGHAAEAEHGALRVRRSRAAPGRRGRRARRSSASTGTCRRPCRGSSSSRADSPTRTPPRT